MKHILFVCTGNTCRSPLAEHLFRHKAGDHFHVKSAGINAFVESPAAEHVYHLLREKGIGVTHQSQPVSPELIEWADLVLTMTESHQNILQQQFPAKADVIYTFKKYIHPDSYSVHISDPFGGSLAMYRETMTEIEQLLDRFIERELGKEADDLTEN